MTIQGALSDLNGLLRADDIPVYYKSSIKKIIETIEQEPCEDCCNGNQIEKAKLCQKSYIAGMEHKQEPKTVSIPEGATNGDAVQIMFNKTFPKTIILYKNDESRLTINPMFSREWWEMPYKESGG